MSWSVNATGKPAEVKDEMDKQLTFPLADAPAGLDDEREKETVRRIQGAISQCLSTFDPEQEVVVNANGHMGFENYDTKAGSYQFVNLSIRPKI
ncbi:MAG: hypothetical protein WC356_01785 [Candidatus Micrarchaeia archaeon]|jgi:hypothetical protein